MTDTRALEISEYSRGLVTFTSRDGGLPLSLSIGASEWESAGRPLRVEIEANFSPVGK